MNHQDPNREPWPFRFQLVFRDAQQTALAWLLIVSVIGGVVYFGMRYLSEGRFVDIDRASGRVVEYQVDINAAPGIELANLPGIGEILAKAIVKYRETHGPFERLEDLLKVPKIGPQKLKKIQPYLDWKTTCDQEFHGQKLLHKKSARSRIEPQ